MLVALSAIATTIEASAVPPVEGRRAALLPKRRAQRPGQPRLIGGLAERDRPRVPDQPSSALALGDRPRPRSPVAA
jgi:hypothetical protein